MPEEQTIESQVAALTAEMRGACSILHEVAAELRKTNETVQAIHSDARLVNDRVERVSREIWTPDNASRIRTLELNIRGLYALLGTVGVAFLGEAAFALARWAGWPSK